MNTVYSNLVLRKWPPDKCPFCLYFEAVNDIQPISATKMFTCFT